MDQVADERRRELEEAYDRRSEPLLSAAYLLLAARDELVDARGRVESELRSRLEELFDAVHIEAFHRLDASLVTTKLTVPDIEKP